VRNSVGFDWIPSDRPNGGDFLFTDNGRDNLGDDIPTLRAQSPQPTTKVTSTSAFPTSGETIKTTRISEVKSQPI
jgi:hypothetical protein